MGAGLTFAVVVALFACGGLWLDDRLGTKPWLLLLGILLGLLGGTVHLLGALAPGTLPFGKRSAPPTRPRVPDASTARPDASARSDGRPPAGPPTLP